VFIRLHRSKILIEARKKYRFTRFHAKKILAHHQFIGHLINRLICEIFPLFSLAEGSMASSTFIMALTEAVSSVSSKQNF